MHEKTIHTGYQVQRSLDTFLGVLARAHHQKSTHCKYKEVKVRLFCQAGGPVLNRL